MFNAGDGDTSDGGSEPVPLPPGMIFRREFSTYEVMVEFRGDFDIDEAQADLYNILESLMTPYLLDLIGSILVGTELSVSFVESDSHSGVELADVVVDIAIQSENNDDLMHLTRDQATRAVRNFFGGRTLANYLIAIQSVPLDVDAIRIHDTTNGISVGQPDFPFGTFGGDDESLSLIHI